MTSREVPLHPIRTVLVGWIGGAVGAAVLGYATGQVLSLIGSGETGAWAALAAAILGAAVGAFVGAAAALAVLFRKEPARARLATVLTTLLGGPILLVAIAAAASRVDQDWNVPPLWLAVAVAAAALAGRSLAVRSGRGSRAGA